MKLQIGSRVKFLNDTGGGIVREFKDDKIVVVETDDGFEMPVLSTDVIVEQRSSYGTDEPEDIQLINEEKEEEPISSIPEISFEEKRYRDFTGEVLVAIVPENDKLLHVSKFFMYIINDSNYSFHYVLTVKDSGVSTLIRAGSIESDTKLNIETYSQTSIAKIKEVCIQGVFYKHGLMMLNRPIDMNYSIEDISFYKAGYFKGK